MKVLRTKDAENDEEEIYSYYLGFANYEIADRFALDVEQKLIYLREFSTAGVKLKGYRKTSVNIENRFLTFKSFPYLLFYSINFSTNCVYVERILHESRDIPSLLKF
jgi:plasmid stabilization system protein ParE